MSYGIAAALTIPIALSACSSDSPSESGSESMSQTQDAGGDSIPADPSADAAAPGGQDVLPEYDDNGDLYRADGWAEWVALGSSLNLNYTGTGPPYPTDIMTTVYMEPTAYRHFKETGEFREGTMTALAAYLTGTSEPPAQDGIFPTDRVAFEMSVKDSERHPNEAWAYYSFGDGPTAPANPPDACFQCHDEHAETDHVFTQFYPMLP